MSAPVQNVAGPINDHDGNDWKNRFNVVLSHPGEVVQSKSAENAQPWHAAFFGCFSPIDLCCMTYCLPCVTFGKTHHRLRKDVNLAGYEPINTSCLMLCGSACVGLYWIPLAMQRADIRSKYNLQGSCLTDIAAACCCGLCDLVQQEKEATHWGLNQQATSEQYQSTGGMVYNAPKQEEALGHTS